MRRLQHRLDRLRSGEEGSATLEFMVIFPFFMVIFVNCFELGMVMLRQTMLDRSIDMVVRDVRVGLVDFSDTDSNETDAERARRQHDILKELICERSRFLTDCDDDLKLEMQVVDPHAWTGLAADIDCVDQQDVSLPPEFDVGVGNQLVLLRACHLFEPAIENFSLGVVLGELLETDAGGSYRLVSTASYVIEPEN